MGKDKQPSAPPQEKVPVRFGKVGVVYRDKRNALRRVRVVSAGKPVEKVVYSRGVRRVRLLPTWNVVTIAEDGREVRGRVVRDENLGHDYVPESTIIARQGPPVEPVS